MKEIVVVIFLCLFFSACSKPNLEESDLHRAVIEQYGLWFLAPQREYLSYKFAGRTAEKSIYIVSRVDQSVESLQIKFEVEDSNDGISRRWAVKTGENSLNIPTLVVIERNGDSEFGVILDESKIPGFENLGEPDDTDNPVNSPESPKNQQDG